MTRAHAAPDDNTKLLIAESESLIRKASAQVERLRSNMLQVRVLEAQRQIALGRLRDIVASGRRVGGAADAPIAPVVVTVVIRDERNDDKLREAETLH